jgi:hypothetical protein
MKNYKMGMIGMALIFGLILVGCDADKDDDNGDGNGSSSLSGTWKSASSLTLVISGNSFKISGGILSGTVSGNTLTPTGGAYHSSGTITGTGTATVAGNTLTISGFSGSVAFVVNGNYTKEQNTGNGDGNGSSSLSGTWTAAGGYVTLVISGNTFTLDDGILSGTVSGNTFTPTGGAYYNHITGTGTAVVSGNTLTILGFDGGYASYMNRTFTKN